MISRLMLALLVSCTISLSFSIAQTRPSNPAEASKLWEKVLAAKGGRERLDAIERFLIIERHRKTQRVFNVDLYVFPNRYWLWEDSRPSRIGVHLTANNGTGDWVAVAERGRQRDIHGVSWFAEAGKRHYMIRNHAVFLLDTKWLRPMALELGKGRIGREEFETITADFGMEDQFKFKYYIEKDTLLVRRVSFGADAGAAGATTLYADLSGYRAIDGIMMPSVVKWWDYTPNSIDFGFNVDYDPAIFTRRPAIEDGPDGWKRAR